MVHNKKISNVFIMVVRRLFRKPQMKNMVLRLFKIFSVDVNLSWNEKLTKDEMEKKKVADRLLAPLWMAYHIMSNDLSNTPRMSPKPQHQTWPKMRWLFTLSFSIISKILWHHHL